MKSQIADRRSQFLLHRLRWLDRLNNFGRVVGAGFLWAAFLMLIGIRNLWLVSIFGVVLGWYAVALWDNWRAKRELRAMRRETMERHDRW